MPGQDSFFLNTQKPEKGLEETQINIMSNLQEAGECLALQVNGVEYQGHDDADRQEIEVEQAELRAPPARPEMKVKSIKISDIKTDAICKYCKTYDCRCLDICYSHCDSHFSHCICYDSCEECNEDPTDCECLLRCEYCHVDVEKNTFIAQGAGCDCITIAATSLAERLADNHIDIDQQDDVGSMVQERLDKYDLHPTPHGTEIDTVNVDNTTAREIRILEKEYSSSFATHSLDCGEFTGFSVGLVMDEDGSHQEKERPMSEHVKNEIKETMEALEKQGIVGDALEHGKFQSNIHVVAKPDESKRVQASPSEFEKYT